MDRLRRGESVTEERDRRIEQRAILLVKSGRDWLSAVVEATREIDADLGPRLAPGRSERAGKASRTASIDALPGGLLARQRISDRTDRERADERLGDHLDGERGPTLSTSLRAQLAALLGFDTSGREVAFAAGTSRGDDDAPAAQPRNGLDRARSAKTLAETLALLDDPEVPSEFARQAAVAHALRAAGSGDSLDGELQGEFGDRLDVGLGEVRVHSDPVSSQIVAALGTRAFAFGRHLFFAPGAYNPGSDAGRSLIAHELAHVAQQPDGPATDADGVVLGRAGDAYEADADHAAGALLAGLRPQVSRGAPVAARFDGGGDVNPESVLRKHIGHDENKAKDALKQSGSKRTMVETIIRDTFEKERADEIIKESKGGAAAEKAPEVKGKGGGDAKGGKGKADAKGKGGDKAGGGDKKGGSKGGDGTGPAQVAGGGPAVCEDLGIPELTPDQRNLIETELAEHQVWQTASSAVGAPGSAQRLGFLMGQAGRGFASGAATGLVMGAITGTVGQLLQRFCPIPGVGAVFAGAMSAYSLATRDWGATREAIDNMGTGGSTWEVIANTLAGISEMLDVLINVMNVIAGVIGLISAVMWLITIITVGIASPLAGTLSAIALGILTVSGILDNINNLILQPVIMVCRIMHAMQSDADPREIQAQGAKVADSASKVGSAVGGYLAGRGVDAVGKRIDARAPAAAAPDVSAPSARQTAPDAGAAPAAQPHAPADAPNAPAAQPHAPADAPNAPAAQPHAPADAPNAPAQPAQQAADAPNAPPAAPPPAAQPAAPAERSWMQKLRLDARTNEQRAQDSQRSWGDRFRGNMRNLGDSYGQHRARYAEQARARNTEDSSQVQGEASRQRRAEIDEQHRRDSAEAQQAGDEASANRVGRAEQRAGRGNDAAERRYAAAGAEADAKLRTDTDASARAAREQTTVAETQARAEHAHIDRSRAELDARYQQELAAARALDEPTVREQAEQNAHQRFEADSAHLDGQRASVDRRQQAAQEAATDGQNAADARARAAYDDAQTRRTMKQEVDAESVDQRLRDDVDAAGARGDRVRARGQRGANADRKDAIEDQHYRGVGTDGVHPDRGGRRSLENGDVTAREWDPGHSPGGAMVREAVEERTKKAAGLDTRSAAEVAQDDAAQSRDRNLGFFDRIDRQLLHGEKSEQQKTSDTRDAAQYRPDHAKDAQGVRKNPHYADPPAGASIAQLDKLKRDLDAAIKLKCEADGAQKAAAEEKQKHEGHDAPLKQMSEEGKKAGEKVQEHKKEVGVKKGANEKQQQKQADAAGKIDNYDSQKSQFQTVITPMRGVERFTYIGSKLGVSHFDNMNKEIKTTLKGFEDMNAQMAKEKANQPQAKADLVKKEGDIKATDTKAQKSDTEFQKADQDIGTIKNDNAKAKGEAAAAEAQAKNQESEWGGKVTSYRSQYTSMATSLVGWAQTHRAARAGTPPGIEAQAGGADHGQPPPQGANAGAGPGGAPAGANGNAPAGANGNAPAGANGAPANANGAPANANGNAPPAQQAQPPAQAAQPPAAPPPPAAEPPAAPPPPQVAQPAAPPPPPAEPRRGPNP